jgi:hypothetical protein
MFLVTGHDGSILSHTLLGDSLLVSPEQVGGDRDKSEVFYFDFSIPQRKPQR